MISMTKNTQSRETLLQMAQKAFPGESCTNIRELTEGYFNVAYLLLFDSGRESVLKIAPPKDARIMSYEKNIMYSEVTAMRLAAQKTDVPVAEILFFDDSLTLCSSPYFFMEKLEGNSLSSLGDSVPDAVKRRSVEIPEC
ncbi:MAG: phosphotransferase family protein [Blautia marasmi]